MSLSFRILGRKTDGSADDAKRYWVAGTPGQSATEHTPMGDESRSIRRDGDQQKATLAAFAKPTDLANESLEWRFSTTRLFGSFKLAWRWLNLFSARSPKLWPHPIMGDAVVRCNLPNNEFEEVYLPCTRISKPTMAQNGQTVSLGYAVTAGEISPYRTGHMDNMHVLAASGIRAALTFYGSLNGGAMTDVIEGYGLALDDLAETTGGGMDGGILRSGVRLWITAEGEVGAEAATVLKFSIGTSVFGHTQLTHPLSLAALKTQIDSATSGSIETALVSTDGREGLSLKIPDAFGAPLASTEMRVQLYNAASTLIYDAEIVGNATRLETLAVGGEALLVDVND